MPDLSVELAPNNPLGLRLKNPVMVASGTFGYGTEYTRLVEVSRLGAIIAKGVTLRPRRGNTPRALRVFDTCVGRREGVTPSAATDRRRACNLEQRERPGSGAVRWR